MIYNISHNINKSISNLDLCPKLQLDIFNCLPELSTWTSYTDTSESTYSKLPKLLFSIAGHSTSPREPISVKETWGTTGPSHRMNPPSLPTSNMSATNRLKLKPEGPLALSLSPLCSDLGQILSTFVLEHCNSVLRDSAPSSLLFYISKFMLAMAVILIFQEHKSDYAKLIYFNHAMFPKIYNPVSTPWH